MQLIILGMHRSGTSVLARLLNMMGAYFGPEGISTGANKENPKGFWERRDVRQLNDFVLHSVNCDWDKISSLDINSLPENVITEFRERASEILLEMDTHRPWLLKEPRLCLLFELWKNLLEVPVSIHIYRNPVEVAHSVYTRNSIPVHVGIALWEKYNLSALRASHGLPRFIVSHNNLMKDPVAEVKYIYEQLLKCGVDGLRLPSKKEITAFVRKELYREKVGEKEITQFLNANQTKMFNELVSGHILKRRNILNLSKGCVLTLEQYEQQENKGNELAQRLNQKEQIDKDAFFKTEAELKRQLEQQKTDLTQQLQQKHQIAKDVQEAASNMVTELKQQLEQQKTDLTQQLQQKHQIAKDAQEAASNIEAELTQQLEQQKTDLTQQLNQKDQMAKDAQVAASNLEGELKRQLEQQKIDLTQQRSRQIQVAKDAQEAASKIESELTQQLEQQALQLKLVKKGVVGIEQYIFRQDEIIKQLFNGVESLVASRRWLFGNAVFSLRRKLLFKKEPAMATDYLKKVRDRYYDFKATKQPIHIHVLDVLDTKLLFSNKWESQSVKELNNYPIQEEKVCSEKNSVDIVVCVHNALEDVKNCLNSITHNTVLNFTLYIIDDGSDQDTKNYLDSFHEKNNRTILVRNEKALGYTKSANIGLRESSARYVILLNSDTVVTSSWDKKIIKCGDSNPKIGIIGPLSNAASWQSIPERYSNDGDWMVNEIPDGMNIDDMGDLVSRASKQDYPIVPLINGFCFAIKRSVLERVGFLDEESFPRGYGEENDYCFRAAEEGFLLAIADDTFVFHAKSKSFTHEGRKKLAKQGGGRLKELHGAERINNAVDILRKSNSLKNMRQAIKFSLSFDETHEPMAFIGASIKVLFLLPVSGGGGGVHSIVQETLGMRKIGAYARVAVPYKHKSKFQASYPNHWRQVFYFFKSEDDIKSYAIQFDVVVATIFTSIKLLEKIYDFFPEIIPAYYIQDYEPWFSEEGTELHQEALISYTRIPDIKCFAKTDWICNIVNEKHAVNVTKVKPSIDEEIYYPRFTTSLKDTDVLTICAMIRPKTPRRAPELTMRVLEQIKKRHKGNVNVEIFGCDDSAIFLMKNKWGFSYNNHGHITREEVSNILRASDLFIDMSEYQAFGRTGLEAMACGCIPVLPAIGGVYEYAVNNKNSIIIETKPEFEQEIIKNINKLITNAKKMKEIKREALQTAKKYNIESAARSEIDFFLSISKNNQLISNSKGK